MSYHGLILRPFEKWETISMRPTMNIEKQTSIFLNHRRERVIITFALRRPFFPYIFDWHPNVFCKEVKPNLWDEGTSSWGFHHFQISKETLLSTCLICRSRKWRFSLFFCRSYQLPHYSTWTDSGTYSRNEKSRVGMIL